jgi:hypothetical protein
MSEDVRPAALPDEVLQDKRSIDLYMIAVIGMVAIGLIAVIGAIVLALFERVIPGEVWTIVGTAVGAIATMLAAGQAKE